MICHYMSGLASEEKLAAYFAKLKERDEKRRQEQEQREAETSFPGFPADLLP